MMKIKQKRLVWSSLIFLIFISGCNLKNKLLGNWEVEEVKVEIADEMKYLQELDSTLLQEKFRNRFPKPLSKGDNIDFEEEQIILNQMDTFQYSPPDPTDSLFYIKVSDMVYPINYHFVNDKMILSRSIHLGKIEWLLKKK